MKVLLIIIIVSGIRATLLRWKLVYHTYMELMHRIKRGFHLSDYFLDHSNGTCNCEFCQNETPEEREVRAKEIHNQVLREQAENFTQLLMFQIFYTSIIIVAVITYLKFI